MLTGECHLWMSLPLERLMEFQPAVLMVTFVPLGFADIPTGKTSPYILRRTTMATRTSPRLAAQKLAASPLSLDKENLTETSKPTAGGSRSQKVNSMNMYLLCEIQEMRALSGQDFDTEPSDSGALQSLTFFPVV